jgi:hypothetical protein
MKAAACAALAETAMGVLLLLLLPRLLSSAVLRCFALLHARYHAHGGTSLLLEWFLVEQALARAVTGTWHQQALPAAAAAALSLTLNPKCVSTISSLSSCSVCK